jgi:hypothetical protein
VGDDPRITRSRPLAAAHALDELPQLIDVLQRPHEPGRPAARGAALRGALPAGAARAGAGGAAGHHRPGLAGHIDEAHLLAKAADPEREYIEVILPRKLRRRQADYAEQAPRCGPTCACWLRTLCAWPAEPIQSR